MEGVIIKLNFFGSNTKAHFKVISAMILKDYLNYKIVHNTKVNLEDNQLWKPFANDKIAEEDFNSCLEFTRVGRTIAKATYELT